MFNKKTDIDPFIPVSNMVSTKPFNTYNKDSGIDNAGIILKNNSTDSFKQMFNEPNVINPVVPIRIAKPDEVFVDNVFVRDEGVKIAMINKDETNDNEYMDVANAILNFKQPVVSSDKLSYKQINDFTKKELDETQLASIYDQMSAKVIEKISAVEAKRIGGTPVETKSLSGLYNPVYSNIDGENIDINNNTFNTEYKFQGFSYLPSGSLIK
jgi:hypothetical protein